MDINFELYKIFYYTGMNLSFTKAAETLFVTQSSVSQSIKQLENKLGVTLFVRNRKKIQFTKEGALLFVHVEQAYKHLKTAERKIENFNIGEINIGASDTICKYFLLPYLKDYHRSNPKIKINIINQPSKKTLEMIQEGLMDFGIVAVSKQAIFKDIHLDKLKDYKEVCIAGESYHQQLGHQSTLKEINESPMITLRSNTNTRIYLDEEFDKRDLILQPEFEMVSVDLIIEMVKADLGIGFAMEDTLKNIDADPDLFAIEIKPPMKERNISFAISQTQSLSEAADSFIQHIKALI